MRSGRVFFFEKKEPENFCDFGSESRSIPRPTDKSLLLLFFRNEDLACSHKVFRILTRMGLCPLAPIGGVQGHCPADYSASASSTSGFGPLSSPFAAMSRSINSITAMLAASP